MAKIYLLHDYRGAFYSSTTNRYGLCSMNLEKLKTRFSENGIELCLKNFAEVKFNEKWSGRIVVYQSAEDPGLQYKSYIEDIILGLSLLGAHVMPSYPMLRAHHNKVFLEILRKVTRNDLIETLKTSVYGTLEDFDPKGIMYPSVIKASWGAGSQGVQLLSNELQAIRTVKKISHSQNFMNNIKEKVKRSIRLEHVPYSLYRNKYIVQEFIPNLKNDYKVLIYDDQSFVVQRKVRDNDFRASGSGRLSWPSEVSEELLNYAYALKEAFDVPNASLDIAVADNGLHLLEAQFVMFGPAALERSEWHWKKYSDGWRKLNGPVELEQVFAESIMKYTTKKEWINIG